jgi:hypothetical protein
MDEDYKKNLLPTDFTNWEEASKGFGKLNISKADHSNLLNYEHADLPPFIKHTLIDIIQESRKQSFPKKT